MYFTSLVSFGQVMAIDLYHSISTSLHDMSDTEFSHNPSFTLFIRLF